MKVPRTIRPEDCHMHVRDHPPVESGIMVSRVVPSSPCRFSVPDTIRLRSVTTDPGLYHLCCHMHVVGVSNERLKTADELNSKEKDIILGPVSSEMALVVSTKIHWRCFVVRHKFGMKLSRIIR